MQDLLGQFGQAAGGPSGVALGDLSLSLAVSFGLCLCIAWVYRATYRGNGYSQQYVHTLIIMGTVVTLIIMIVGSSVARAFALVGALSIIRFRNAVKETRDIGFIFLAMAVGMGAGTGLYVQAALATLAVSGVSVMMWRLDWFSRLVAVHSVRVRFDAEQDYEPLLREVLARHCRQFSLVGVETARGGAQQEVELEVQLAPDSEPSALLRALRGCNGNNKAIIAARPTVG